MSCTEKDAFYNINLKIYDASYTSTEFLLIFLCLLPDLEGKLCNSPSSYHGFFLPDLSVIREKNSQKTVWFKYATHVKQQA